MDELVSFRTFLVVRAGGREQRIETTFCSWCSEEAFCSACGAKADSARAELARLDQLEGYRKVRRGED